jgi:hypothetical protein
MKYGADQNPAVLLGVENNMGLEAEPAQADQQLVGCDAHLWKISQKPECALQACMISLRLIDPKVLLSESADVADLIARLQ